MKSPRYGFVLLAAGNSSRLGSPKGLLPYRETTLLGHVLREMQKLPGWPIVAVTGADAMQLDGTCKAMGVDCVYNAQWKKGMSSSIRIGIQELLRRSPIEGALFAVCDQPAVNAGLFHALARRKDSGTQHIIASGYSGAVGIPVLFGQKYFTQLQALSGEKGAQSLLKKYPHDVASIPLPWGEIDIDTPEDYQKWKDNIQAL